MSTSRGACTLADMPGNAALGLPSRPVFLLVDDDRLIVNAVARFLGRDRVHAVTNAADALAVFKSGLPLLGVLVDIALERADDGWDVLAAARHWRPSVIRAAFTGSDPPHKNRAMACLAYYVEKGCPESLRQFTRIATACSLVDDRSLAEALGVYAQRHGLCGVDTEVVGHTLAGARRRELPARMGKSAARVKKIVKRLLRRTCAESVAQAALDVARLARVRAWGVPARHE